MAGQERAGRTFRTRNNEHSREIQTNGKTVKYAQHLLNTTHNYDTMESTMKMLQVERKGKMLEISEKKIYIYNTTKQGLQMNENSTNGYNPIYEFFNRNKAKHSKLNPTQSRTSLPTSTTPTSSRTPPNTPL
jgi:hypothetical protein